MKDPKEKLKGDNYMKLKTIATRIKYCKVKVTVGKKYKAKAIAQRRQTTLYVLRQDSTEVYNMDAANTKLS